MISSHNVNCSCKRTIITLFPILCMASKLRLALQRCIETTSKMSTPLADATIQGCQLALSWMTDNSERFEMFASILLAHLNSCFKDRTSARIDSQAAREKMWNKFRQSELRLSLSHFDKFSFWKPV